MRIDLEFNVTGILSETGLEKASNIFYSDEEVIEGFEWDTLHTAIIDNEIKISDTIQTGDKINGLYYGGRSLDSLNISSTMDFEGTTKIFFSGGDYEVFNNKFSWSNNSLLFGMKYEIEGYYSFDITEDIDLTSIDIFTLRLDYPGNFTKDRSYEYVDFNTSIEETFRLAPFSLCYTIYNSKVYLSSSKISYTDYTIGKSNASNNIFALPEFPVNNIKINGFSDNEYSVKSGCILFKKDSSIQLGEDIVATFDIVPVISFSQIERKQKDNIVFDGGNISPITTSFENGALCLYNSFTSESIPIKIKINDIENKNMMITDYPKITASILGFNDIPVTTSTNGTSHNIKFSVLSNNAKWKESQSTSYSGDTGFNGELDATLTFDQDKLGFYIQNEWVNNIVSQNDTYGEITVPFSLPILDSGDILNPDTLNDVLSGIYIYAIYSNDPILGSRYASVREQGLKEFYSEVSDSFQETLSSYEVNGRKVAYVKIQEKDGKIVSLFNKPYQINKENKTINIKDLFIKPASADGIIKSRNGNFYYTIESHTSSSNSEPGYGVIWERYWKQDLSAQFAPAWNPDTEYRVNRGTISGKFALTEKISEGNTAVISGLYKQDILPNNNLDIYNKTGVDCITIRFSSLFPKSDENIIGYWLVTDRIVNIQAEYSDDYLTLKSDILKLNVKTMNSESPFLLSGTKAPGYITTLGDFGYLNVTEYLSNPFGLKSCSYYCLYSDAINKKCIHKDKGYHKNFIIDDNKVGCIHTIEYDATIPEVDRCKGVDSRLVNPYILPTSIV